jgi:hypothetical protein
MAGSFVARPSVEVYLLPPRSLTVMLYEKQSNLCFSGDGTRPRAALAKTEAKTDTLARLYPML